MKNIFILIFLFISLFSCSQNKTNVAEQPEKISSVYQTEKSEIRDLGNEWFEVTGSVIIENITPDEARELAIEKAQKKAIEYYSGVEVTGKVLSILVESNTKILQESFMRLTDQTCRGIIIEKEIINEWIQTDGNILNKIVVLKVKVGKQKGEKDPYFNLTANLNREHFQEYEKMELSVISTKDCYLSVFAICSNDSVYFIFPNQYRKNNYVEANEVFNLPDANDKKMGLSYPMKLLSGKEEDTEIIKVIATKDAISFHSFQTLSAFGTYQSALTDLLKQLMKIPRDDIEEVDLQYFISK
ncbi:MAG: DUF4384 domain-containing protein [Candidatus Cloacimonetes bacterium]|nr:DUF4384 domain-containing protein [Candidatus Cloacimonadota bacterium]